MVTQARVEKRAPSLYRLTYLGAWNAGRADATGTHEYQKIKTVEEAELVVVKARKPTEPRNVDRGKMQNATPQIEGNSPHKLRAETKNADPQIVGYVVHPRIVGYFLYLGRTPDRAGGSRATALIGSSEIQAADERHFVRRHFWWACSYVPRHRRNR
jgi:hypothetical protein